MAEFRFFYKEDNRIKMSRTIETVKTVPIENFLWIDLNDVTVEVESELEQFLKIYIQEEEEMEEIEISSRYIETADSIVVNSQFLLDNFEEETVSLILKNGILISVRSKHLHSFNEIVKKIFANPRNYLSGYSIFVDLLATRVDYDADMIEDMARQITELSNEIKTEDNADDDALIAVKNLQEKTMIIRENIVDKQRGKSEAIYHYQGYKLAFRTHPLFVRQARISARRYHRSYQHTAKQDNKDFHHRVGNIYAAYTDSKYLWNEFHRILDIAMAIRSTVFDSTDDTLRSGYLVVLQKEKMVLDNNNQSKTYIHITIWL